MAAHRSEVSLRPGATLRTLNTLVRTCRDSDAIHRAAANVVVSADLRNLLRSRAEAWGRRGEELQALVLMMDGTPACSGNAGARVLSLWVAVKAAVLGHADAMGLEVCDHAQMHALDEYEQALEAYMPERIRRTLTLQADRIADRAEALDALLDQYSTHSQSVRTR